jgi:hypothetical protein
MMNAGGRQFGDTYIEQHPSKWPSDKTYTCRIEDENRKVNNPFALRQQRRKGT